MKIRLKKLIPMNFDSYKAIRTVLNVVAWFHAR